MAKSRIDVAAVESGSIHCKPCNGNVNSRLVEQTAPCSERLSVADRQVERIAERSGSPNITEERLTIKQGLAQTHLTKADVTITPTNKRPGAVVGGKGRRVILLSPLFFPIA